MAAGRRPAGPPPPRRAGPPVGGGPGSASAPPGRSRADGQIRRRRPAGAGDRRPTAPGGPVTNRWSPGRAPDRRSGQARPGSAERPKTAADTTRTGGPGQVAADDRAAGLLGGLGQPRRPAGRGRCPSGAAIDTRAWVGPDRPWRRSRTPPPSAPCTRRPRAGQVRGRRGPRPPPGRWTERPASRAGRPTTAASSPIQVSPAGGTCPPGVRSRAAASNRACRRAMASNSSTGPDGPGNSGPPWSPPELGLCTSLAYH